MSAREFAGRAALLAAILIGADPALASESAAPAEEAAAPADEESSARQFAAAIDGFNALDPQSPDTLNTRLAYADLLTKLKSGDCHAHLEEAQRQLDLATATRALTFALPAGLARVSDLEYQLHSARASCGADATLRDRELHAALESAQRAVDLYRDEFDAISMVTMQFNVGVVYHDLGDTAAATAALQQTLDLDREYGFADDAEDNYRLLLQWNNEDFSQEQIDARMKDFPERSATLSFGWFASDASLTLQSDVSELAGTESVHFQASRAARRQVREGLGGWVVSHQLDDPHFEFGGLPAGEWSEFSYANSVARLLLRFHDFRLDRHGDFERSKADFRFQWRARTDARALARNLPALAPNSVGARRPQLARAIRAAVGDALLPETIEAQTAEDYNLEAGTWIGATLEQGVWYDMTAGLFLPLAPGDFMTHKIQFTYSRPVPCTPGASELSCIEIVLRAVPDPIVLKASLDTLTRRAQLADGQEPRFWSATTMRLVTDPKTLWTYRRETCWHVYWSTGLPGPDQSRMESEKTIVSISAPR